MNARFESFSTELPMVGRIVNSETVAGSNRPLPVPNPAAGEVPKLVAMASVGTVKKSITSACEAFSEWRGVPTANRSRIVFRTYRLLEEHSDRIAALRTTVGR